MSEDAWRRRQRATLVRGIEQAMREKDLQEGSQWPRTVWTPLHIGTDFPRPTRAIVAASAVGMLTAGIASTIQGVEHTTVSTLIATLCAYFVTLRWRWSR